MNRRTFLTASAAALPALAGCLDSVTSLSDEETDVTLELQFAGSWKVTLYKSTTESYEDDVITGTGDDTIGFDYEQAFGIIVKPKTNPGENPLHIRLRKDGAVVEELERHSSAAVMFECQERSGELDCQITAP